MMTGKATANALTVAAVAVGIVAGTANAQLTTITGVTIGRLV